MKLTNPVVVVAYMTVDDATTKTSSRTHSRYQFKGVVDRKRVLRTIRRSLKSIGIHAPKFYIQHFIRTFTSGRG